VSHLGDPVLEHKLTMNRETWKVLGEHGVREGTELTLDFFFFAPGEDEARALAAYVEAQTDYEVEVSSSKGGLLSKRQWAVNGSTRPTPVSLDALDELAIWMIAAGRAHAGEYDGWGAAVPDA
jgi:hypothetical protein